MANVENIKLLLAKWRCKNSPSAKAGYRHIRDVLPNRATDFTGSAILNLEKSIGYLI